MGKATILSHAGDGLYTVSYERDVSKTQERLLQIQAQRDAIFQKINEPGGLLDQRDAADAKAAAAKAEFEAALQDWSECQKTPGCTQGSALKAAMVTKAKARIKAKAEHTGLIALIAEMRAVELSLIKEVGYLQSAITDRQYSTFQAYSLDFPRPTVEGGPGPLPPGAVVGTVETFGDRGVSIGQGELRIPAQQVNLAATFSGVPSYAKATHGATVSIGGQSTATALNNVLQFLYAGFRNPRFAVAKVVTVNGRTSLDLDVYGKTLDNGPAPGFPFLSTAGNPIPLNGVPTAYMDCTCRAFKKDDWVVIKTTGPDYAGAEVIGFAEAPRDCNDIPAGFSLSVETPSTDRYASTAPEGEWAHDENEQYAWTTGGTGGGNLWHKNAYGMVSWWFRCGGVVGEVDTGWGPYVYWNGHKILTATGGYVYGAALAQISGTTYIFAVVSMPSLGEVRVYKAPVTTRVFAQIASYTLAETAEVIEVLAGDPSSEPGYSGARGLYGAPAFFNTFGTAALMLVGRRTNNLTINEQVLPRKMRIEVAANGNSATFTDEGLVDAGSAEVSEVIENGIYPRRFVTATAKAYMSYHFDAGNTPQTSYVEMEVDDERGTLLEPNATNGLAQEWRRDAWLRVVCNGVALRTLTYNSHLIKYDKWMPELSETHNYGQVTAQFGGANGFHLYMLTDSEGEIAATPMQIAPVVAFNPMNPNVVAMQELRSDLLQDSYVWTPDDYEPPPSYAPPPYLPLNQRYVLTVTNEEGTTDIHSVPNGVSGQQVYFTVDVSGDAPVGTYDYTTEGYTRYVMPTGSQFIYVRPTSAIGPTEYVIMATELGAEANLRLMHSRDFTNDNFATASGLNFVTSNSHHWRWGVIA